MRFSHRRLTITIIFVFMAGMLATAVGADPDARFANPPHHVDEWQVSKKPSVASHGEMVVAVVEATTTTGTDIAVVSSDDGGQTWGDSTTLGEGKLPSIALTDDAAFVAWYSQRTIYVSTRNGVGWSAPTPISRPNKACSGPALAAADGPAVVFYWECKSGKPGQLRSRRTTDQGTTWGDPVVVWRDRKVTRPGLQPAPAVDACGKEHFAAGYISTRGHKEKIYVAVSTDSGTRYTGSAKITAALGRNLRLSLSGSLCDTTYTTWTRGSIPKTGPKAVNSHVYLAACLIDDICAKPVKVTSGKGRWVNQDLVARGDDVFVGYSKNGMLFGRLSEDQGETWWPEVSVPGIDGKAGHWRMSSTPEIVHSVFHANGTGNKQVYYTPGIWP